MKSGSGTRYGPDHLPETRRTGGPGRPGGVPKRPSWHREVPTSSVVDDIPTTQLRAYLTAHGLSPFMVDLLVQDRRTAGGRWRITQELLAR